MLAKALGHPARLRILKAAGIITGEVERARICYTLNAEALKPLQSFLDEVARQTTQSPKTE